MSAPLPTRKPNVSRRIRGTAQVGATAGPITADFRYTTADQFAVSLQFATQQCWTFARELVRTGLYTVTGDGDVTVATTDSFTEVAIYLSSPHGEAVLTFPREQVYAFICATEKVVPFGQERIEGMDAFLDEVLRGAR
jgi:hypothetical protein